MKTQRPDPRAQAVAIDAEIRALDIFRDEWSSRVTEVNPAILRPQGDISPEWMDSLSIISAMFDEMEQRLIVARNAWLREDLWWMDDLFDTPPSPDDLEACVSRLNPEACGDNLMTPSEAARFTEAARSLIHCAQLHLQVFVTSHTESRFWPDTGKASPSNRFKAWRSREILSLLSRAGRSRSCLTAAVRQTRNSYLIRTENTLDFRGAMIIVHMVTKPA